MIKQSLSNTNEKCYSVFLRSGVLFPPLSGELEGDGLGAVLYAFFFAVFSCVAMGFWDVATNDF
jgi:hypothetical protein